MPIGILRAEAVPHVQGTFQVIDARRRSDFNAGHIPGALWMGWEEWCNPGPVTNDGILRRPGYWGELRHMDAERYAARLTSLGLRSDDPIVVYADGPQSRGREGRIAWMLLYLGASVVSLLNGGWQAWLDAGGDVRRGSEIPTSGHFLVTIHDERRWTLRHATYHQQLPERSRFVDTRSSEEFSGEIPACLSFRGHIPGAVLVPFATLFDARGRYIDQASYVDTISGTVQPTDTIVAYCEVGVRACLFALLHEAYTGHVVSVFDGSIADWALNSGRAVSTSRDK